MKYKDMSDRVVTDEYGFKFIKDMGIMVGDQTSACITCGDSTVFIDVCSEGHVCSEECNAEFYKLVTASEVNG